MGSRAPGRCSRRARTRRRPAAEAPSRQAPVGPGGLPLARPDKRVTLPLWEDPIASGLKPETGGTFTIFNYPNYLYTKLFKEFCAKYDVTPQYTAFDNIASGIQRLASGSVEPDVMEMTPDNLDQVVAGQLINPLNLDYIPNLKKNVWPQLVSPFYDSESRYTVPYTTYATGIFWRNDHVTEDIAGMPQPWDIFWQSQKYSGKTALLSEDRETIAMALLRKGITDINTEDPKLVNQAVADLKQLYSICNIKVGDSSTRPSPRGPRVAQPVLVGRPALGLLLLPPQGHARERHELLEGAQRPRACPERLLVDLHDHQEAGALAPVAELHPRQRRRLLELRELQRLPAAAERDRPEADLVTKNVTSPRTSRRRCSRTTTSGPIRSRR